MGKSPHNISGVKPPAGRNGRTESVEPPRERTATDEPEESKVMFANPPSAAVSSRKFWKPVKALVHSKSEMATEGCVETIKRSLQKLCVVFFSTQIWGDAWW